MSSKWHVLLMETYGQYHHLSLVPSTLCFRPAPRAYGGWGGGGSWSILTSCLLLSPDLFLMWLPMKLYAHTQGVNFAPVPICHTTLSRPTAAA